MTLIGFLEKPPTLISLMLAVAFIVLGVATGWWPTAAGVGRGLLLMTSLAIPSEDSFAIFGVLIPITILGLHRNQRARMLLAVWYFAGLVMLTALRYPRAESFAEDLSTMLFFAVLIIASWLLGSALHALSQVRRHEAQAVVRGVQVTVAQELHDTVAHSLSLIAMRSDQARLAGQGTPEDLSFIAAHSRQAIHDLRGMLEALRRDPHISVSQENPWQVDSLESSLAQFSTRLEEAGFTVAAITEGDLGALPTSADRTLEIEPPAGGEHYLAGILPNS